MAKIRKSKARKSSKRAIQNVKVSLLAVANRREVQFISDDARSALAVEEVHLFHVPGRAARQLNHVVDVALAEHFSGDSLTAVRSFANLVYGGITPTGRLLAFIAERFRAYDAGNATISLDEAFSLQPRQKSGHPIAQARENARRGQVVHRMWLLRQAAVAAGKTLSIENAAAEVINQLSLDVGEDTLERSYRKMRADAVFGAARAIIDGEK